jgi:hypothetical protein
MPKRCAVWLDHSKAWIVTFTPEGDAKVEMLESGITAMRKTTGGARCGTPYLHGCATRKGDDEKRQHQLAKFYESLIGRVRDYARVLVIGPGLARQEFHRAIETLPGHTKPKVLVRPAARMTERQLVALARRELEIPLAR